MNFAGVGVGPYDLAAGVEFLQKSQAAGFPWLSANLLDKQHKPIFQPSRIQTIDQVRIGLIGLTGTTSQLPDTLTLVPYTKVLQQEIDKLADQCDFIVLLSSLSKNENEQIGLHFPSINVIITAITKGGNSRPRLVNNSLISQTMAKGKYQGVLTITLGENLNWDRNDGQQLAALENRLGSYDWQLKRMKKRKKLHTPTYLDKISNIEMRRDEVLAQVAALKEKIEFTRNNNETPSTYTSQLLALKTTIPHDTHIQKKIITTKYRIKQFNKKLKKRKSNQSQTTPNHYAGKNTPSQLAGFRVCVECHEPQVRFWEKTAHADSYTTLTKKDQNFNLDCIGCHVTLSTNPQLLAEADKQKLLHLPDTLRLVGCESCHGPGLAHADDPETIQLVKVLERTCLYCHTEEHSDQFNFDEKVEKIRCPAE